MAKTLISLKRARFFHEQNLDRKKRPVAVGGKSEFVAERVLDQRGKTVKQEIRRTKRARHE